MDNGSGVCSAFKTCRTFLANLSEKLRTYKNAYSDNTFNEKSFELMTYDQDEIISGIYNEDGTIGYLSYLRKYSGYQAEAIFEDIKYNVEEVPEKFVHEFVLAQ